MTCSTCDDLGVVYDEFEEGFNPCDDPDHAAGVHASCSERCSSIDCECSCHEETT